MANGSLPNTEGSNGLLLQGCEWICLAFAALPAVLLVWNLFLYRGPRGARSSSPPFVSVLIPARNEERSIEACVRSVTQSQAAEIEVLVLDDHSEDGTAAIVKAIASQDPRVRLLTAPPLPTGWCGKQHACAVLASQASATTLFFLDADVRVQPDCVALLTQELRRREVSLLSGFPHQKTVGFSERLLLPLMHVILLGFLPIFLMRRNTDPAFAAGCGQLFVADRAAYRAAGGHGAIRASRHDGIQLPKAFRRAGLRTDLCDLTSLASCRMYNSPSEVFFGLFKNATEGLAAPARIVPFTALLTLGQVLPVVLFWMAPNTLTGTALFVCYLPRLLLAGFFRQSWVGTALNPLAVIILLAIQWMALIHASLGFPSTWKGRSYSPGGAA